MVLLTKLRSNASGMEANSKRKSWKRVGSVPWGSPRNAGTSNTLWSSSGPLYRLHPLYSNVSYRGWAGEQHNSLWCGCFACV